VTVAEDLRCPVCQARFRGTRECPRCGADLGPLMALAARSRELREEAWRGLERGDYAAAFARAREAQSCRATPAGERLVAVARWLGGAGSPPRRG
jgi:predicted amidophosphoribosyltransferase